MQVTARIAGNIGDGGAAAGRGAVGKRMAVLVLGLARTPVEYRMVVLGKIIRALGQLILRDGIGPIAFRGDVARTLRQVRLVALAHGEIRGEGGKALLKVERNGVTIALIIQGELLVRLLRHPRRERGHFQLLAGKIKFKHAQQTVAALVGHLIVLQDGNDVVPSVVLIHAVARTVMVAAHHQEDLVVALDERIPQALAIIIGIENVALAIDIEGFVRRDDDGEVGVLIDDALRPRKGLIVGAPAQRKVEVLLALGFKDVGLGVIIDRSVALLEGLRVCGFGAIGAKPLVIRVSRRTLHVHVVIAGQNGVVQIRIIEDLHGLIGYLPFALHVPLVDDIAQVGDKIHVQLVLVVYQPLSLGQVGFASIASLGQVAGLRGGIARIELGIW